MIWRRVIGFTLLLVIPALGLTQEKKGADKPAEKPAAKGSSKSRIPANAVPGYTVQKVRGFHLLISDETKTHLEDEKYALKPMEVLDKELAGIERVMTARMLQVLRTIAIFVEWDDPESKSPSGTGVIMARYWYDSGRGLGMLRQGRNPLKANNIEILTMRHLTEKWQPGKARDQIIILHELSHAVHSHLLGNDNPNIAGAYKQALDRGLYGEVKHETGRTLKAYAGTSDHEYFAELSCAYLDKCAYFPFTREDLREYDPVGFRLMEQVWGKGDNRTLAANKKAAAAAKTKAETKPTEDTASKPAESGKVQEEKAAQKLELIDILVKNGFKEKARDRLQDLIRTYPATEAAKRAKETLDKLK